MSAACSDSKQYVQLNVWEILAKEYNIIDATTPPHLHQDGSMLATPRHMQHMTTALLARDNTHSCPKSL